MQFARSINAYGLIVLSAHVKLTSALRRATAEDSPYIGYFIANKLFHLARLAAKLDNFNVPGRTGGLIFVMRN